LVLEPDANRRIQEFSVPTVPEDGLLLKVELARITQRDKAVLSTERMTAAVIPGCIALGYVQAVGQKAASFYEVKTGDRVVVEPFTTCYRCKPCLTAKRRLCAHKRWYGAGFPLTEHPGLGGAYSEYMYVRPGSRVHKVPDSWDERAAVLLPEAIWVFGALFEVGQAGLGKGILIDAPTVPGLLAAALARESGLQPIVMNCDDTNKELATRMGALRVFLRGEKVEDLPENMPAPDLFLVTSCDARTFTSGVKALVPGGTVVVVDTVDGVPKEIFQYGMKKEIAFKSISGPGWDVKGARNLLEKRQYPFAALVTHVLSLNDLLGTKWADKWDWACVRPGAPLKGRA
jgi:D-arabinose 1-dehydrogenase-like Zn-dependent alcohol dehydrogenase